MHISKKEFKQSVQVGRSVIFGCASFVRLLSKPAPADKIRLPSYLGQRRTKPVPLSSPPPRTSPSQPHHSQSGQHLLLIIAPQPSYPHIWGLGMKISCTRASKDSKRMVRRE